MRVTAEVDGPEHKVYRRAANDGDVIWLDICDASYRVIAISKEGWKIVDRADARFVRNNNTAALPLPHESEGDVSHIKELYGLEGEAFLIVATWASYCLQATNPYPILVIHAPGDSGKTWLIRHILMLLDPYLRASDGDCNVVSLTKSKRDTYVVCASRYAVAFDNVSEISDGISDALCETATGGSYGSRKLYEDDDPHTIKACAPIIIGSCVEQRPKQDFVSRSISIKLEKKEESKRLSDKYMEKRDPELSRKAFRAMLDLIVAGLNCEEDTLDGRYARMISYAQWGEAIEKSLGFDKDAFKKTQQSNQKEALTSVLKQDQVGAAIFDLMRATPKRNAVHSKGEHVYQYIWDDNFSVEGAQLVWRGYTNELLRALEDLRTSRNPKWPATAGALGRIIRGRLVSPLAAAGITFQEAGQTKKGSRVLLSREIDEDDNAWAIAALREKGGS